jgi:replication factor C subunit 3/5
MSNSIPWVEKYRPDNFDKIILSDENKNFLNQILKKDIFPNLILYGPPGTGKTTTIINIIRKYQEINNQKDNSLVMHLNASDDRGIDIIRNSIYSFVNSKNLFTKGLKFVILDEVDYMTKTAQLALKYLIQMNVSNVRYCLICNYISKIDQSLLTELILIRFNELPQDIIVEFLKVIIKNENLLLTIEDIKNVQQFYKSDIRSMINYIQNNSNNKKIKTISNDMLEKIYVIHINNNFNQFYKKILDYSNYLLIDYKILIKNYIYFLLINKNNLMNELNIQNLKCIYNNIYNKYSINYLFYLLSQK